MSFETAMSPSPKSERQAAPRAKPTAARQRHPRLNPMMACDTAFRLVARRFLADLTANHDATCRGSATALHQMRIALTRLRAAISFFAPMIADPKRKQISAELKWLHRHLGVVRDLDVAIEHLEASNKPAPPTSTDYRSWNSKRAESHRDLARALRSARYRRLVESLSGWIESGPWSTGKGKQAAQRRTPIAAYSARKLARWQEKLLKKSRKLEKMDAEKRHRLRLLNKKLCYSIEFLEDLHSDKRFSRQPVALKYLRKAQKSLGRLNDDANRRSLTAALERNGVQASLPFLGSKREKRLIRAASEAYRKLAALKSVSDLRR
jgi:CHAD domain-containing protein